MKRALVLVLLLVAAWSAGAWAEERVTVFMDLAWGDPPEALGEPILIEDNQGLSAYRRADEVTHLGSVPVTDIVYGFSGDGLLNVRVSSSDPSALLDALRARYGRPTTDRAYEVAWRLPGQDTYVSYKRDVLGRNADFSLTSISLAAAYNEWRRQQAQEDAASW